MAWAWVSSSMAWSSARRSSPRPSTPDSPSISA
ncbi:hypothetical protein ACFSKM_16875 [Ancylobacter dichloromethanicus]